MTTSVSAPAPVSPVRRSLAAALTGMSRPRMRFAAAILLAALASGASVGLMATSGWLLSRAAEMPPVLYLMVAVTGVRTFGIFRGVFRYVERLVGHDLALRAQSSLRLQTYGRLAGSTLLGRRVGDLISRAVTDVDAVLDVIVRVLVPFASAGLVAVATVGFMAVFDPAYALVLLATCVASGVGLPWLAQRISARAEASIAPARGRLADRARELNRTAVDLVTYGCTDAALARLAAADEELAAAERRSATARGVTAALQVFAAGAAVLAGLVIGGLAVAAGDLPRTMLAVFVLTPFALHEVLGELVQAAQAWSRSRGALARVADVLDAPQDLAAGTDGVRPNATDPVIRLTDATLGWSGQPVLSGVNLHVGVGDRVALVGPSGIGKTTAAAAVLGMNPPLAGDLEVRGRFGYLAQDAHLFATTIAENVRIGNKDATDEQVERALRQAGLDLDPERVLGEFGSTVSGGEARRIALARLLVAEVDGFVLDEPTEHLDVPTAARLMADVWQLVGDRPALVITHDPDVTAQATSVVSLDPAYAAGR
ncbi:thiol reductant ABC exporter subunit CydC [Parenemella sanctibonifatiensis]|uniref:Thiol reductant ABC exporter subunit CydC n=1 Tax=Parenemella sanctibonifatiensis TaxID=2016505 RepID=A0A255ED16_9ACTN|nr:thiol reductant ABC exporter subunit CydC [Parenemella sanctibonifatiensis]OYN89449.1 thiol reductant ABC exporter subunit CydC [Parenemella sanctibonifatiensis]